MKFDIFWHDAYKVKKVFSGLWYMHKLKNAVAVRASLIFNGIC